MIILTQTTDSIKVYLKNAVATNQMQCYAAYRDSTSSAFAPSRNVATTNNAKSAIAIILKLDSEYNSIFKLEKHFKPYLRPKQIFANIANCDDFRVSYCCYFF